ncbi:unnamed protein product [Prunus armeniaca]
MSAYLAMVKTLLDDFIGYEIIQIPRLKNTKADALARLASSFDIDLGRSILVEFLEKSSIEEDCVEVFPISFESTWMDPIRDYLAHGVLPEDKAEARRVRCQEYVMVPHQPPENLTPISSPWPFAEWGIDLIGPMPKGKGQTKFAIVVVDYFTKWAENIICRFGIPYSIVTDNGKQFDNGKLRELGVELNIKHFFASPAHPQAINKWIKKNLKRRLKEHGLNYYPKSFGRKNFTPNIHGGHPAQLRNASYQQCVAHYHNSRVKPRAFQVDDLVLRKVMLATRKPSDGSLGPTWERPYRVIDIVCPGAYRLRDLEGANLPHPWNVEHLKKYYQRFPHHLHAIRVRSSV